MMMNKAKNTKSWMSWIDQSGSVVSGLCALHCAALPLVLWMAPFAAGLTFWHEHETMIWVITASLSVMSVLIARMTHKGYGPMICAGLAWLWWGLMMWTNDPHHVLWISGVLLFIAHLWNRHRSMSVCGCAHEEEPESSDHTQTQV